MPRYLLQEECREKHGFERITLEEIRKVMSRDFGFGAAISDDVAIERFVRSLSRDFAVSKIAMRIRLETLGIVVRTEPPRLFALKSS